MSVVKCCHPTFCEQLESYFNTFGRRGFASVTTINIKEGKTRLIGVRYCDTNKSSDKGVMLNFCPWCGANLQWWSIPEMPSLTAHSEETNSTSR